MKKRILSCALFVALAIAGLHGQAYDFRPGEPYGGQAQVKQFVREVLYYPETAREQKTEGKVEIAFHLSSEGKVEKPFIKKSLDPATDAEALRVFSYLLWEPANSKGAAVASENTFEVEFRLKKYRRCVRHRGYDSLACEWAVDSSMKIYETRRLDQPPAPEYDDISRSFDEFILRNMKYPDAAIKQGISGTVELFFLIEPWGGISNVRVLKNVAAGCDQEALRLLRMLHWKPGMKDGKAVRTKLELSITFSLSDFEKHRYVPAGNNNQM